MLDGHSGDVVGHVTGLTGAHGVALAPEMGLGYVTNNNRVTAFNLLSLTTVKDIPTDSGADAVAYDVVSHRVFSINGKAQTVTVIDAATGGIAATIPVGGKPEFAVTDNRGKLFVNMESTREIVRIDTIAMQVDGRWPIADCEEPHGLAMDVAAHRLFASCVNSKLVAVDAESGHVQVTLPIGKGSDAVVFDPTHQRVFSSNGDGTMSIIGEQGAAHSVTLEAVATAPGAHTMAMDYARGRIFLVTAEPDSQAQVAGQRRRFVPGTVKVLIFDPK